MRFENQFLAIGGPAENAVVSLSMVNAKAWFLSLVQNAFDLRRDRSTAFAANDFAFGPTFSAFFP